MSEFKINLNWAHAGGEFNYETYVRAHEIKFNGGQIVKNSSAPEYKGDAALSNPEELFLAALSSCHMLTFLAVAAKSKLVVKSYTDSPVAFLEKNSEGKMAVTRAILNPKIEFEGAAPDSEKLKSLHDKAHHNCMIGNSCSTKVEVNI